jgi:hypothetical protein
MEVANTLAFCYMLTITAVKSFIEEAPGLTFAGKARIPTFE